MGEKLFCGGKDGRRGSGIGDERERRDRSGGASESIGHGANLKESGRRTSRSGALSPPGGLKPVTASLSLSGEVELLGYPNRRPLSVKVYSFAAMASSTAASEVRYSYSASSRR